VGAFGDGKWMTVGGLVKKGLTLEPARQRWVRIFGSKTHIETGKSRVDY
jgi:hypothetical protein